MPLQVAGGSVLVAPLVEEVGQVHARPTGPA